MGRVKEYCINIKPIAWSRAKLNGQRFFDGQSKDKLCFGIHLNQQHKNEPPFSTAISLDITFFMPLPKTKKKRESSYWHSKTPDADNLLKFLCDTMVKCGILTDDRIVAQVTMKKIYSSQPRTELTITELD